MTTEPTDNDQLCPCPHWSCRQGRYCPNAKNIEHRPVRGTGVVLAGMAGAILAALALMLWGGR